MPPHAKIPKTADFLLHFIIKYCKLLNSSRFGLARVFLRNEGVVGSSPVTGTRNKKMAQQTIIIIK